MTHATLVQTIPQLPPLLRWAGSKRQLVSTLATYAGHIHGRYIEPFAGSACLFFAIRPQTAVLGDLNDQLIGTYRTVRHNPGEVANRVHSWALDTDTYYAIRDMEPEDMTAIDRAARFIYLNRRCFNGVYRTNRKGQFNVPIGGNTGALPSEARFRQCASALRHAELRSGDFAETIADAQLGDFVYLDPPYSQASHVDYGVYGYGSFSGDEIQRLETSIQMLNGRGVRFLLSYRDDPDLTARLASSFQVTRLTVRAQVAGGAAGRGLRDEILVHNAG